MKKVRARRHPLEEDIINLTIVSLALIIVIFMILLFLGGCGGKGGGDAVPPKTMAAPAVGVYRMDRSITQTAYEGSRFVYNSSAGTITTRGDQLREESEREDIPG